MHRIILVQTNVLHWSPLFGEENGDRKVGEKAIAPDRNIVHDRNVATVVSILNVHGDDNDSSSPVITPSLSEIHHHHHHRHNFTTTYTINNMIPTTVTITTTTRAYCCSMCWSVGRCPQLAHASDDTTILDRSRMKRNTAVVQIGVGTTYAQFSVRLVVQLAGSFHFLSCVCRRLDPPSGCSV